MVDDKKLIKAGVDVGLSAAGLPGVGSVVDLIAWILDPGKSRQLDAMITAHLLSELPRMKRLLEERLDQISASGCTPVEAQIIVYQTIEAQKRTLDDEKRRLLTNVLVNAFCDEHWDKAKHKLMLRAAEELEPEHVEVLRWYEDGRPAKPLPDALEERARRDGRREIWRGLTRELIARGLLTEDTQPNVKRERPENVGDPHFIKEVTLSRSTSLSGLGATFLAYLREPTDDQRSG